MLPADARSGTTVGKYRLHEIVGRGGMGVVYRGEHVYIGKEVAVKILHDGYGGREEAIKRFLREARAASLINHPNIVTVTDFGKGHDGTVFFVMELLRGDALDAVLQRDRQLPLMRAITILNQVTAALAAAHGKGIIHRDLKPENVMLIPREGRRELLRNVGDESGAHTISEREKSFDFVKILDFGVAKVRENGRDNSARSTTQSGIVFGTPEYMAPETARVGISDVRTDVYALGAMFYEMLTGTVPFTGETAMDVMVLQVNGTVQAPRERAPGAEITAEAERLILRSLAKDPDERPQTMEEFHRDLQKCYGEVRFRRTIRTPRELPVQPGPAMDIELEWSEVTPVSGAHQTLEGVDTEDAATPIPLLRRKGATPSPEPEIREPLIAEPPPIAAAPVLLTKKKDRGVGTPSPVPLTEPQGRFTPSPIPAHTPAPVPARPSATHGTPAPVPARTSATHGTPAPVPARTSATHGTPGPVPARPSATHGTPGPIPMRPSATHGTPGPVPLRTPQSSPLVSAPLSPPPGNPPLTRSSPALPVQTPGPVPLRTPHSSPLLAAPSKAPPLTRSSPALPAQTPGAVPSPRAPEPTPPSTLEPTGRRRKTLPLGTEVNRPSSPSMPVASPASGNAETSSMPAGAPTPRSSPASGAVPVALTPSPTPSPRLAPAARRPLHEGDPNGDVITPPPSAQRSGR